MTCKMEFMQQQSLFKIFFSNLILGTEYELKNRYMHVDYVPEQSDNMVQSAIGNGSKGKICTLNCPLDGWLSFS